MSKKKKMLLLDFAVFAAVTVYLLFKGNLEASEVAFLYVFENFFMLLAYVIFLLFFVPIFGYKIKAKSHEETIGTGIFLKLLGKAILFASIVSVIFFFVLAFFDQTMVELIGNYLVEAGYNNQLINLVSNSSGLIFEGGLLNIIIDTLQLNLLWLFILISGRYFVELVSDSMQHIDSGKDDVLMNGSFEVFLHSILGPISMFLSMLVLMILSAIFGAVAWVMIIALVVFRLLSQSLFSTIKRWIKETDEDNKRKKTV